MISNLKSYLKIVLHTDDYNETKLIDDYDVGSSLSTAQSHSVSIFNRLYSRHNIFFSQHLENNPFLSLVGRI